MKQIYSLLFFFVYLLLSACDSDDDKPAEVERSETIAWIEDTMRNKYYWKNDIPAADKLDYSQAEEDFFTSLLYKAGDGKTRNNTHSYYSYIEKTYATRGYVTEDYTYGIEISGVRFAQDFIAALVLSVMDGSPAKDAGIKRGDWIISVGGKTMTTDVDMFNLYGGPKTTMEICQWSTEQNPEGEFINNKTIEIEEAKPIDYNPIHYYRTYTVGAKKVGYLVYNSFKAGINDTGTAYDDKLRDLSNNEFNGVHEFILDLRYNGGGLLSCTELMCAILCPDNKFGSTIGYLEYNDKRKTESIRAIDRKNIARNLNLNRLFVLVSASTASASEAVINLLDPWMEVVVIGMPTEGKNLASLPFTSPDKAWEMHPITSKIFNSDGKSEYANGWTPDIVKGDVFDYTVREGKEYVILQETIYEFGDPKERLLNIALQNIAGTYTPDDGTRSIDTSNAYELGPNSIDRRSTPAVIID